MAGRQSSQMAILGLGVTRQVLCGPNNSVNVMSGPHLVTLRTVKKILKSNLHVSREPVERRPVMGRCGTCESICQKPGSSALQLLQPGHCWLIEAGKQANTKDLTWWDKSMNEKDGNPGQVASPSLGWKNTENKTKARPEFPVHLLCLSSPWLQTKSTWKQRIYS